MIRLKASSLICVLAAFAFCCAPAASAGELRVLESRHYRIHTDLEASFAEDLARRMDTMYDEYARRFSSFTPAELPPLEVYLFQRQSDYLNFTGERLRNTGGVFMSSRNLLAAFLEGQGRSALRRTLQHEAFHQFAHAAISPNLPIWLNEGMAQVFEEGIWTGDDFWLGQVPPRRIRQLRADLSSGRTVDFVRFTSLTPQEWSESLSRDQTTGATQYSQSWAMVHFLVHARDLGGKEKYRTRLLQMLKSIHGGADASAAFERSFSNNIEGFQARFIEYANTLEPTPEAALIENQGILADLLMLLRASGQTYDSVEEFRAEVLRENYRLQYTKGQSRWTPDEDLSTYFKAPNGQLFTEQQLFFEPREGAPLPDMVCRLSERIQLRTRFFQTGDKTEHELLVEAIDRSARIVEYGDDSANLR